MLDPESLLTFWGKHLLVSFQRVRWEDNITHHSHIFFMDYGVWALAWTFLVFCPWILSWFHLVLLFIMSGHVNTIMDIFSVRWTRMVKTALKKQRFSPLCQIDTKAGTDPQTSCHWRCLWGEVCWAVCGGRGGLTCGDGGVTLLCSLWSAYDAALALQGPPYSTQWSDEMKLTWTNSIIICS